MKQLLWTASRVCALTLLVGFGAASAQAQVPRPSPPGDEAVEPAGGPQEGIKVHGDWTIVVRNADGSVASRHEFKNALLVQENADQVLARLLAGQVSAGHWSIGFAVGTLCNPNNSPCTIAEPGSFGNSQNLTRVVTAKQMVLNGSVKVSTAGNISFVQTSMETCSNAVAPSACQSPSPNLITGKFLDTQIAVVANQTVDVTVVISFS